MTVLVNIGRRVPRHWVRRQVARVGGLISFQEHIWSIIRQSLSMAKKKANASGKVKYIITTEKENEDINYQLQWIKVVIRGGREIEEEEYEEALQLYQPLGNILKKEIPKDDRLGRHFKTKVLTTAKVDEAYKRGFGSVRDNNMANKLLEMGILTHVELIDDYDSRNDEFVTDF